MPFKVITNCPECDSKDAIFMGEDVGIEVPYPVGPIYCKDCGYISHEVDIFAGGDQLDNNMSADHDLKHTIDNAIQILGCDRVKIISDSYSKNMAPAYNADNISSWTTFELSDDYHYMLFIGNNGKMIKTGHLTWERY